MNRILPVFLITMMLFITSSCGDAPSEETKPDETNEKTEDKNVANKKEKDENEEMEDKVDNQVETESIDNLETNKQESAKQEPLYKINEANWTVEPVDGASENVVLLTIDDAPDKYGLKMAQSLKQLGVGAIFFVNGHFIDSPNEKEVLKQIFNLGFKIGNHTWNHKNLKKLTEQEQYDEIVKLNDEIEAITGERPRFFRAPFGANTDYAKELVKKQGMTLMNWTYGYDFMEDYMTKESLEDIMVNTDLLINGANLLMHDREWTYEALPSIVKGLRSKGYELVDPHLIQTKTPTP
jgi:peptidoglycan/xylan/chitin deacetylase (PgdA/CDA1 family)